ncbi:AAC(3) family N-acetyltransferase [Paenibacillus sp. V4I5]|uniref:AAC(3) family N-acetyltransferase n=1 Tax=Paenibacillus sp. V4I5 TaxID=3042306 RepID=UPI0027D84FE0|nr:AAC(3) family N-acetyltransferase [Paenibacillus sp. V4I5]
MEPLTRESLIESFNSLGIRTGTRLVVHSSLRNLGPIDGGADTVLDALISCIGSEGLLVMPTFTYQNEGFNPDISPSKTGILSELLRKRPDAVRSLHPTHSITAIGDGAVALCEDHFLKPGLGINSPLDLVAKMGGGILLLGVGHTSNSTVHVGEAYAKMSYLDIPFRPSYPISIPILGSVQMEVELLDPPGCSRAFGVIEALLRKRSAIQDGLIGKALVQWISGEEVISATTELLRMDDAALLCSDPTCYRCSKSRERLWR